MERFVPPPVTARSGVNLPADIITEILCRLPVKSLIRFRCVSKSWYFLITDHNFIKKHLSQSTNQNPKRVMACSPSGVHQVFSFHLPSLSSANPIRDLVKNYPRQSLKGLITILDVFNGLFCIFIDAELFLWNPSIRESKRLLSPPNNISLHDIGSFAFSYDSFSDDYIIVWIVKFPGQGLRRETRVYSLKTDSWRKIQECPYPFYTKCNGKFANGLFYWLLENHGDQGTNPSHEIISLDLSTEKYEKIPFLDDHDTPANDPYMPANEFGLTVLSGMLCIYINCRGLRSHFVLWMMKDNSSVSKSWTKIIQLQHRDVPKPSPKSMLSCHCIVPRYLFENGELLLEAKENNLGAALVLYAQNGLGVRIKIGRYVRESYVYEESLLSPYLDNEI